MSLMRCDPRAFARCPYKRSCVRIEDATFTEGSDCHRFNERVLHYCQAKQECMDIVDHEQNVPDSWCKKCLLKWLKAPADQEEWKER